MHYPLVTIVGGSGFVGRHTVKQLASAGYRIRVLARDVAAGQFLKTAATVGSIAIEYADIAKPETLAGKLAGSDAVINLVGIAYERGRGRKRSAAGYQTGQNFGRVHIAGARAVAEEAKRAGATHFIQISALGVPQARDSDYAKSKLAGEEAVRAAFPEATILRPSVMVGAEDHFFQRFAQMAMMSPVLPLIAGGRTKFQPVLVTDVALAIADCMRREETLGKTYELGGPETYSFRALLELLARITNRRPYLMNMPRLMANIEAAIFEALPFPPLLTRDQVRLLGHDNVVQPGALTFADLGIAPTPIEAVLPMLLARYIKV